MLPTGNKEGWTFSVISCSYSICWAVVCTSSLSSQCIWACSQERANISFPPHPFVYRQWPGIGCPWSPAHLRTRNMNRQKGGKIPCHKSADELSLSSVVILLFGTSGHSKTEAWKRERPPDSCLFNLILGQFCRLKYFFFYCFFRK